MDIFSLLVMTPRKLLLLSTALVSTSALAGGKLPGIVSGSVSFLQSANRLTITESTPTAILNWQDFSVAKGEIVQFVQPSASSSILNRVTGSATSVIDGLVQANGQVLLLNPNGITVGATGQINAASLLLTSSGLKDQDYLAGRLSFTGIPGQGAVTNHGTLAAADGGTVVLSAPQVSNDGTITAHLGRVVMGAAAGFTLDPAGDGLWSYQITEAAAGALAANAGTITADGGSVQISARSLDQAMRDVINNTGMIQARSVRQQDGEIILDGGDQGQVTLGASSVIDASAGEPLANGGHIKITSAVTSVDGVLLARGGAQGGDGGLIETSGESLKLLDSARVDVDSPLGHPGSWLLDPTDFVIDATNNTAIENALNNNANVTVKTASGGNSVTSAGSVLAVPNGANPWTSGDIVVTAPIAWTTNQTLTLDAYHSVLIDAAVSASGANAGVSINYGSAFYTGLGAGVVTLSGANPSLSINGTSYTLIKDANGLQNMATSVSYALANDIDLSGVNGTGKFLPIGFSNTGNNANPAVFTGTLDGLGHSITNFTINDSGNNSNLGLISSIDLNGKVRNLIIAGGSVTAGTNISAVGMLAGENAGYIDNVMASGTVTTGDSATYVGGLVGWHGAENNAATGTGSPHIYFSSFNGTVQAGLSDLSVGGLTGEIDAKISATYTLGSVSAGDGSNNIGGLVGLNNNNTIMNSYSEASVSGGSGAKFIGGLIGENGGFVSFSYATGAVVGGSGAFGIGGLVGANQYSSSSPTVGTIKYAYATGSVSGGDGAVDIGGLVGDHSNYSEMTQCVYSTGVVRGGVGATNVGALIGTAADGNLAQTHYSGVWVNTGYWDTGSNPSLSAIGQNTGLQTSTTSLVGLTDAQAKDATNFATNYPGLNSNGTDFFALSNSYPALIGSPYVLSVTPANKSATYGAAVPAFSYSLSGFWPGDAGNLASAVTLSSSAGATPNAASYTITSTGGGPVTSAGGQAYQIYDATATLTIKTAPLSLTANNASKTYGTTASFAGTAFTPTTMYNGDSVTSVSETSTGATPTATVGTYAITPSTAVGTGLSNYSISYKPGTLTVNKANLTITANDVAKTYGQSPTYSFTPTGLANSDTFTGATAASGGAAGTAAVGSYPITPSAATGVGIGNYSITYANGTLTVTPANLTITANAASKTYGTTGGLSGTAFTASGLVNGDAVTGVTETSGGSAATAGVGSYVITPSAATGTGLGNYSISYTNGTLTVTPANLTVTANDASKTYGQTPTYTFTPTGLLNGDSFSGATATSGGTTATAAVGSYAVTPSAAIGSGLSNYAITYAGGILTVTPAPLTITASDRGKTYGDSLALGTTAFSASPTQNGETVTGVTLDAGGKETADGGAGSWPIKPSAATGGNGFDTANYVITYNNGTLTVKQAPLTVTAGNVAKMYGQTANLVGTAFTDSGLRNHDHVDSVNATSFGAAAAAPVGQYPLEISQIYGSGLGNYLVFYQPGTLTVTQGITDKTVVALFTLATPQTPQPKPQPPTDPPAAAAPTTVDAVLAAVDSLPIGSVDTRAVASLIPGLLAQQVADSDDNGFDGSADDAQYSLIW